MTEKLELGKKAHKVKVKTGNLRVKLDRVHPNSWNPNVMPSDYFKKLKKGLSQALEKSDKMPPIVVRPDTKQGGYEIIDGFHRWKAFGELKQGKINVYSIEVDDKTARILTNTLNYLRGSPDRERYAQGIVEMIERGATYTELSELLPESTDELDQLIDEAKVSITAFENLQKEDEDDSQHAMDELEKSDTGDDSTWVELKFKVALSQAKVIEQELKRIGSVCKGRNIRGRALELMAVQSSQNALPEDL